MLCLQSHFQAQEETGAGPDHSIHPAGSLDTDLSNDTSAHENSPASLLLSPTPTLAPPCACLGHKVKTQETGSVQLRDPTQGNRPNTAYHKHLFMKILS